MKKYVVSSLKWLSAFIVAFGLVVAGGGEEKRELEQKAAKDTRLVATIAVFRCGKLAGLWLVPQHSEPIWHSSNENIPLLFYKDSVMLSINGIVSLTVPCPATYTSARSN